MVENAFVAIVDFVPGLPEPETEVDVLEVVVVRGVESICLIEDLVANEHAGARDNLKSAGLVDCVVVRGASGVDM